MYHRNDLQKRQMNLCLQRKNVIIHSEDRDAKKWPNPSRFEVHFPQQYLNVESIRLVKISLPDFSENFSKDLFQNTMFSFKLIPMSKSSYTGNEEEVFNFLNTNKDHVFTVTIPDGQYSIDDLTTIIEVSMNKCITKYLRDNSIDYSYSRMKIVYDSVTKKCHFGNSHDNFVLLGSKKESYPSSGSKGNPNVLFNNDVKWGFYYNMGISQKSDVSGSVYVEENHLASPRFVAEEVAAYSVVPENRIHIEGEHSILLDLNKFNNIDEEEPYPDSKNKKYSNDSNGRVNSCFAQIFISEADNSNFTTDKNSSLTNIYVFNPPVERISKLNVELRYHDGTLVDLKNKNFVMTLEVNSFIDEIAYNYQYRVPSSFA